MQASIHGHKSTDRKGNLSNCHPIGHHMPSTAVSNFFGPAYLSFRFSRYSPLPITQISATCPWFSDYLCQCATGARCRQVECLPPILALYLAPSYLPAHGSSTRTLNAMHRKKYNYYLPELRDITLPAFLLGKFPLNSEGKEKKLKASATQSSHTGIPVPQVLKRR